MTPKDLFHRGELAIQQLAGKQEVAERVGSMIAACVPENARSFLTEQSALWVGVADQAQQLQALVLSGAPGFITANTGDLVEIDRRQLAALPAGWSKLLCPGQQVGCLAIEFKTRRRLRINGVIAHVSQKLITIKVNQAYPNCPKYIKQHDSVFINSPVKSDRVASGFHLDDSLVKLTQRAETMFVASQGAEQMDLSHRGGKPGFISVLSPDCLLLPEYRGNNLFNTLGNFTVNPSAGLLIADFNEGQLLQLGGRVQLNTNATYAESAGFETQWNWRFTIQLWKMYKLVV